MEFLRKALQGEISSEGIVALKKDGEFGPLSRVFPKEAAGWANQAGVKAEDCVAFKLERNGQRSEVVLWKQGITFLVLRCNNVGRLASRKH